MKNRSSQNSLVREETLKQCEAAIGYTFTNIALLAEALTHASIRNEKKISNERLEFLGDAVLGLVVSEFLYLTFRDFDEGDLSLIRSDVVSRSTLAKIAKQDNLQNFFVYAEGIGKNSELPISVLANIFEAIVGAMYLDSGMEAVRVFILDRLRDEIERVIKNPYQNNYKSLLQFLAQKYLGETPSYQILPQKNHSSFSSCVVMGKRKFLAADGANKKESEQSAAQVALQILALEEPLIAEKLKTTFAPYPQGEPVLVPNGVRNRGRRQILHPTLFHNSQSLLQHIVEKFAFPTPVYHKRKDKEKKIFFAHISLGGRTFPQASSPKSKEAEKLAARITLEILAEEHSSQSTFYRDFKACGTPLETTPFWYCLTWP
jgi:ribonuclease-3